MGISETTNEFQLNDIPEACVSAVKFGSKSNQFLLVSSWDNSLRLYNILSKKLIVDFFHDAPVLDCCFESKTCAWSGGLDKEVKSFDFVSKTVTVFGAHTAPVGSVVHCPDLNVIITGSWDKTIKIWDPRAKGAIKTIPQPDKVYAMDECGQRIIVGTAGRRVLVWNLRHMRYLEQRRESSLKFQTRCIKSFPNKEGFVMSSIEGRVAMEYLDSNPVVQKKKYAFKCHRMKDSDGFELIYSVNALAFHNKYNSLATGGSDGFVNVWDCFKRRRLCQFHRYPTGISSLSFSPDGSLLAIASSYLHELETKDIPSNSIFIRTVTEEAKPKQ